MSIKPLKWIHGWQLVRFFKNIFQVSENGDITVGDAAAKVISVIDQTLALWAQVEPLYKALASDEGDESADNVKAEVINIKSMLEHIQTLPDIADALENYRFADDDVRNAFYHSLISSAALMFSDKEVSLYEAVSFLIQIATFIKGK